MAKSGDNKGTIRGDIRYLLLSTDVRQHRLISTDCIKALRCYGRHSAKCQSHQKASAADCAGRSVGRAQSSLLSQSPPAEDGRQRTRRGEWDASFFLEGRKDKVGIRAVGSLASPLDELRSKDRVQRDVAFEFPGFGRAILSHRPPFGYGDLSVMPQYVAPSQRQKLGCA